MPIAMADSPWRWIYGGSILIVVDAASCTLGILQDVSKALDGQRRERLEKIHIIGSASWAEEPLPKLSIRKKLARAVLPHMSDELPAR